ncbi:MAG: dUTP diphosphatase [Thermoanaerobaculia bacterium]
MSDSGLALRIARLPHASDLPLPRRASAGSAGFDLAAAVAEPLRLAPGERALVPTGWCLEIPRGYEAQVRPRSGLALRFGLTLLNSPGTIDSDYRGAVKVRMIILGAEPVTLARGERIAQLVVASVAAPRLVEVEELSASDRGAGGFGSTGTT